MRRTAIWATLALAVAPAAGRAQTEVAPPTVYALTNARILVAPGRVVESGTVVIRDGRIAAAGASVAVPAGAVRMDLAGRTVHAGWIDVASTVGVPSIQGRPVGGPQGGPPGPSAQGSTRPEPPPEIQPGRSAGDVFAPTDNDRRMLRDQGITAVGLAFDGGLLPGRIAAALTGDGQPGAQVVRSPVAQQVVFGRRRGGYPGTLMGAIAFVKQAYFNADHAARVNDAFRRDPAGSPRPVYDAAHEALWPSLRGEIPAWFVASAERDFARAAEVASEVGIENWALLGAQEAYRALDAIRGWGVPLIVSVDFPEPSVETGRAFELHAKPAAGEDSVAMRADSAAALRLRSNPAEVARAGIRFALASYGLTGAGEFRRNVHAAVAAGLPPDDALRALTVTPAGLLGLEASMGTVEAGKLANLVIVVGDPFREGSRIQNVFVEGRRYDVRQPVARRGGGGAAATGQVAVAGEWFGSIEIAGSTMPITLTLEVDGRNVSGNLSSEAGETPVTGEIAGDELTLRGTFTPPGMNAMAIGITGRVANDELRGTLSVQGQAAVPFTIRRRSPGSSDAFEGGLQ
jgi:imidazolonepropionase-like amidohydrolase